MSRRSKKIHRSTPSVPPPKSSPSVPSPKSSTIPSPPIRTPDAKPILEARGVRKAHGTGAARTEAVKGVDFHVAAGEFVAIMGPSGSGKSTLLHMLGGLDTPTAGHVFLEGKDFGGLSDDDRSLVRRRRMGFVFQKINLLSTFTAGENVAVPLMLDGRPKREAVEIAKKHLAVVGLADRIDHLPSQLSGGEQQRVAIARALAIDPALILADEPTGALDQANGKIVMEQLRACVDRGCALAMVTHDPALAEQADRIVTLRDGLVVEDRPSLRASKRATTEAAPCSSNG